MNSVLLALALFAEVAVPVPVCIPPYGLQDPSVLSIFSKFDTNWANLPANMGLVIVIMQHLNPQLKTLMKDVDFKGNQPLLFGENFGEKGKARMEVAATLQKIVTLAGSKGRQTGFQKGQPQKNTWGRQGGKSRGPNFKSKKFQG